MIIIATKNKIKIEKIKIFLIENDLEYKTLEDLNISLEIEENCQTIKENAIRKAEEYFKVTGLPCIATDSGVFIDNVPLTIQLGVYSGRKVHYNEDGTIKKITNLSSFENYQRIGNLIQTLGGHADGKLLETFAYIDEWGSIKTIDISIPRKFQFPGSNIVIPGIEARSYIFNDYFCSFLSELNEEQMEYLDKKYYDVIYDFFKDISNNRMKCETKKLLSRSNKTLIKTFNF